MVLQGTNIVVAAASTDGRFLVFRYDTNGGLDTANFGTNGVATTSFAPAPAFVPGIALQSDNKIILTGGRGSFDPAAQPNPVDQVVVRYTADGQPDTTFGPGANGIVITDINLKGNFGNVPVVQVDGKIAVVGHANVNFDAGASDISVVRYDTSGNLDPTFVGPTGNPNPAGIVVTDLGGFDNALSIAVQSPVGVPKLVVSGNSQGFLVVLRYNANGTADTAFGTSGLVAPSLRGPSTIASGNALAVQPDQSIVVSGYD